jgi:hypothetical protein
MSLSGEGFASRTGALAPEGNVSVASVPDATPLSTSACSVRAEEPS